MDTFTFLDHSMKFLTSVGWLVIATLAIIWLRQPIANLIDRIKSIEVSSNSVRVETVEQDVNDASQQAAKVLPPEVKHEIMGQHHPITIEAHLDVSDVLNEVEKLRDVSTPAMMIEAYRVFEVFLRHTLRQRAPEDSGWPSASLPDYAVKHGLLNAGQAEVLHRLREIRDDCSRLERGAHVNQGVSHRYVTALREMTCTIDKRMKDATRRG